MILISPWGDPRQWSDVTYIYDNVKLKSKTSLKILQQRLQPEKTLIIGLDTLAKEGSNYSELKKDAETLLEESVKEFGLGNTEILIAPGKGDFFNGTFEGNMMDYYYYTLWKLSEMLIGDNIPEEIHLDLTHGINFMPVLTYRAVKQVLGVLGIFKRDIKLRVYNADPFVPNVTGELSINMVEDSTVIPTPFKSKVKDYRIVKSESLLNKERKNLFKDKLAILRGLNSEDISAFLSSIYNGLPLVLCTFYPETSLLENSIKRSIEIYKEYIKVERGSNKLKVKRLLKFTENFEGCVIAYLMAKLVTESVGINTQLREPELKTLKLLNKKVFVYDKRLETHIGNEVYNIEEKNKKSKIKSNWRIYSEILERNISQPNPRNFLAHSGFERNTVELRRGDGGIFVRYKKDVIDIVKNFCLKGMI